MIEFPSDLTAITGPNGSGKSNVMEAVMFAMGARGSWLRSQGLRGLIRKGATSCSVELVLRHPGGALRLERRITRSGGSYRLNGRLASANEVRDALAELGLRADGHNFVSQGEVTAVIESTPRERAALILEISGVEEFERKREETLRELERVEERIRVLRALQRDRLERLEFLRRRAEAYREREELERRLASLEKAVLLRRMERAERALEELQPPEAPAISEEEIEEMKREVRRAESELRKLEGSEELKRAREAATVKARISTLRERLRSLDAELEGVRTLLATMGASSPPKSVTDHPDYVGIVAELVRPMEGYEMAYRAVAGARVGDVVVRTLEAGLEIVRSLRGSRLNRRIRVLPLDVLRPPRPVNPPEYSLGLLRDYVLAESGMEGLVGAIVGNAVLVEDLDSVPRSNVGRCRFVSLHGEILERDGSILSSPPSPAQERRLRRRLEELLGERERVRERLEELEARARELPPPERAQEVEEALREVRRRIDELRADLERAMSSRLAYERRMRAVAEERGKLTQRLEELRARLASLKDVEAAESDDPESEYAAVAARLRIIPLVGPDVLEELRREEAKAREMDETLAQLEEARTSIERALDEIAKERDKVLRETVEKVSRAFNEAIKEMFGGEGEVWLSGEWPRMELEVRVNLPEKGEVPMEALSGGEKSLTALAFIYALQSVRPSPLYFFDEADMMLDGRNCKRYAALLRRMVTRGSQVIIISLKKDTLEEADAILGVRMVNGESRVVGVRLDEFDRVEYTAEC